uniref:Putative ovule protein n=1 Tax=Solanum chacoense TaxID=4108 RepID=A0A0V0IKN9_SOLCH
MLEKFKCTSEEADRLWWKLDSKGIFKENYQRNQQAQHWPWKHIWKTKIPFKVVCFTWLLAREAVLTREKFKKRKFSLCSRCYLCGEEVETVSHLFLQCRITTQLWRIFLSLRGISWS